MKAAHLKLKPILPTEDDEAQSLIRWAITKRVDGYRLADLLIMVPNGAYLGGDARQRAITMAKLKRTGFKVGCADYLLPVARKGFHGLALELKRQKLGVVSPEQRWFMALMTDVGWLALIANGWEEAKRAIEEYLQ